ncbi:ribulokinase, partial [bacterium]|nr:ribulokinase [bacterium]
INRFEEYGVSVKEVINCGGIAERNPFLMQIYADIIGRPMKLSGSSQTCALGAAMFGAVAAGKENGGYERVEEAQAAMSTLKETVYYPIRESQEIYQRLFALYQELHDVFGTRERSGNLAHVMKDLLRIRDEVRG